MLPESIKILIESFKTLPGIGEKTAERLSFSVLELEKEQVDIFAEALSSVLKKVHKCRKCNTLTEHELCFSCTDSSRNDSVLCVVEDTKTVFLLEKLGIFNGRYHVLNGLISPLDGINPEDIGIDKLLKRIEEEKFSEIIFAFKPSIEGETTSLYIKKVLSGLDVVVTKLASGVPMGVDMEYVDFLTLERALKERKRVE